MIAMHECETMTGVQHSGRGGHYYDPPWCRGYGKNVHIYSQDTDVQLLALRRTPLIGDRSVTIMGTTERRLKVFIQPIYDTLGPDKSGALINWYALTGCDMTGHIHEKGKNGCLATFKKAYPTTMIALDGHGQGDEPSEQVLRGCEEFLCSIFCPRGVRIGEAKMPMEHGLNICAVPMSILTHDTMIWY